MTAYLDIPLDQVPGGNSVQQMSARALEIGKAAEHLVCADLILAGYRAFLSDQGLPYDVVVDLAGRLVRLQVKATCEPKNVNAKGRNPRCAYNWNIRRCGKHGKKRLTSLDCDVVALVALDIRVVAYIPIMAAAATVQLTKDRFGHGQFGWSIQDLQSFDQAVAGQPFSLAVKGRRALFSRKGQQTLAEAMQVPNKYETAA